MPMLNIRGWLRPAGAALAALLVTFHTFAAGDATLIERVEPVFPHEATQAGVERGMVKVRMTVDSAGEVTRVEILEANPRRLFDRAVIKTLSQWRFNSGKDGRSVEIDIEFKR